MVQEYLEHHRNPSKDNGNMILELLDLGLSVQSQPMHFQCIVVEFGLGLFIAGTLWDFDIGRRARTCAEETCEPELQTVEISTDKIDPERRQLSGAAMSIAAAGIFYGL